MLVGMAAAALSCGQSAPRPILVFAAASLEDAIAEVASAYTARTGLGVALNTAGSNVLAQQIEAGAPADVFVSADARWIDELIAGGSLDPASRRELLSNRLVVIAHSGAGYTLESLALIGELPFRYLSIADPDSVPAGRYARSLLERHAASLRRHRVGRRWRRAWRRLPTCAPRWRWWPPSPTAIGIVYRSDVIGVTGGSGAAAGGATAGSADSGSSHGVEVLLEIEREPDPPIRYVAALVRALASARARVGASSSTSSPATRRATSSNTTASCRCRGNGRACRTTSSRHSS